MQVDATSLPNVLIIKPKIFRDPRGFFVETYHEERYRSHGMSAHFVQDNFSQSVRGTLRGLHAQLKRPQAKLVRCVLGSVWDVAVDIRVGSPTFGRWAAATLDAEQGHQIFIPEGFVHGFVVLTEVVQIEYKCSDVYVPDDQLTVRWDDPQLGIPWPAKVPPILSDKDRDAPLLKDL
ncbi:MAG TPA: dTDP-4-dehydrorhamnose 3,5-epimerase, partial [bacterium]|nr:dTDP-4-dehydrorhamnose 3,5-epimerase [bacterium]